MEDDRPSWEECAARGMTRREAANLRGQSYESARRAARRGVQFRDTTNADKAEITRQTHKRARDFPKPSYDGPSVWVKLAKVENARMRVNHGL